MSINRLAGPKTSWAFEKTVPQAKGHEFTDFLCGLDRTVFITFANFIEGRLCVLWLLVAAPGRKLAVKLDNFAVELIDSRMEHEVKRGIWPSFGHNFPENSSPANPFGNRDPGQGSFCWFHRT
jgi:hypothetical protein